MKSKTKYQIEESKIKEIFRIENLGNILSVSELKAGEYNSAYYIVANGKEYVLKVAPKICANILTYEQNIIAREVAFYKLIAEQTEVNIPKIYCYNDSKTIIPSSYFIMEKLASKPLTECKLQRDDKENTYSKVGEMVAELHKIKGVGFGYEQNGMHENWYLAIKSMVNNLIGDCERANKKAKKGYILLDYIEMYKDILMSVESTYTHFDIWDGNIFYQKKADDIEISLIDTERSFWGDSIGDFVSVEMFADFKKKVSIASYNKTADSPIQFTREELVRFNIMRAYLGLIVHSEKYVRYNIWQSKYMICIFMSSYLLNKSFSYLKNCNDNS